MAKGIKRLLAAARKNVESEIKLLARQSDSIFSRGLSTEGYHGGYLHALDDVLLALNGNTPQRHGWWLEDAEPNQEK